MHECCVFRRVGLEHDPRTVLQKDNGTAGRGPALLLRLTVPRRELTAHAPRVLGPIRVRYRAQGHTRELIPAIGPEMQIRAVHGPAKLYAIDPVTRVVDLARRGALRFGDKPRAIPGSKISGGRAGANAVR